MKAIVNVQSLSKELKKMSHIVGKKNIIPITSCVLMKFSDGLLTMVGTDLETTIISTINDCTCGEDFSIPIEYTDLVSISNSCNSPLEISVKEKHISIVSGKSKFKLSIIGESEHFPNMPETDLDINVEVDGSFFYELLKASQFRSKDLNFVNFNNVGVGFKDGKMVIVGTDANTAYVSEYEAVVKGRPSIMVTDSFITTCKSFQQSVIKVGNKYIEATCGDTTVTSRLSEQNFVKYEVMLKDSYDFNVICQKSDILFALKKMLVSSDTLLSVTQIDLSAKGIKFTSTNTDTEKDSEDFVSCDCSIKLEKLYLNTNHLIALLNAIDSEEINIMIQNERDNVYISPADSKIICLIRPLIINR